MKVGGSEGSRRDNGKENGNYYSILGLYIGFLGLGCRAWGFQYVGPDFLYPA